MADIFVSYKRADAARAAQIVALLQKQGWSVWWDTRIADDGERGDATIKREINAARCVVVIWSPNSIDSEKAYWVHNQAHNGRERGILVPVSIGGVAPPFAFKPIQTWDLTGWDGTPQDGAAGEFLANVQAKLGRGEGRIEVDAAFINNPHGRWFLPGAGNSESFKDLQTGPEIVVIPAGEFWMGSEDNEGDADERPRHKVTIPKPFAVGRYAVTFEEWDAAVAAGGVKHKPEDQGWGRGRRPVINVSWEDTQAYAKWLSDKTGMPYRLLSEAEWEYCCRAGTETAYSFGDKIRKAQAQFSEGNIGSAGRTVEAGSFPANSFGLYDMHGNVWEWCQDCWNDTYKAAPGDGSALTTGDCGRRVLRGGSWVNNPSNLRSAIRDRYYAGGGVDNIGFRVARTL